MLKSVLPVFFLCILSISIAGQVKKPASEGAGSGRGAGNGVGSGNSTGDGGNIGSNAAARNLPANALVRIISKPPAIYTDAARKNNVQGKVTLSVTFKKDGTIGKINVVEGLPDGLSVAAVEAARKIRFEPERRKGKPVTVAKNIIYSFTLF